MFTHVLQSLSQARQLFNAVRKYNVVPPDVPVTLNTQLVADMRAYIVDRTGVPNIAVIAGSLVWSRLVTDPAFQDLLDLTSDLDQIKLGYVGSLLTMPVFTEGYTYPEVDLLPFRNVITVACVLPGQEVKIADCVKFRIR